MPPVTPIINRFTAGEVSPLLTGRVDLLKHSASAERLENFLPLLQGPLMKRPGTRHVDNCPTASQPSALIPFVFSASVSYVVAVSNNAMRFYRDGAAAGTLRTDITQAQIFDGNGVCTMKWAQSGDVMYIVSPNFRPKKLCRVGEAEWEMADMPGWGSRPNPGAIALFRERLCLAAGPTLYLSQTGAFENFELTSGGQAPVAADDPIEINIYSDQVNKIEWMVAGDRLMVGTTGGEFTVGEVVSTDPLGPDNIKVSPETSFGTSPLQALRVGGTLFFFQRAGRKLREFSYDFSSDNYQGYDQTAAAQHVTQGGVVAMAWQSEPLETLWMARADGELLGFTYNKEQDMAAWHRHKLGGGGRVKSLCVIPAKFGGDDELYMCVAWDAASSSLRETGFHTIVRMAPCHNLGDDPGAAFFVDGGVTATSASSVGGLAHLNGQAVAALADGKIYTGLAVSGGSVALPVTAQKVTVGAPYKSVFVSTDLETAMQDGVSTAQGRIKRIVAAMFRLLESRGGQAGPREDLAQAFNFQRGSDAMDAAGGLYTGDYVIDWPGGWERVGQICVTQDLPAPFILAAVAPRIEMEGRE